MLNRLFWSLSEAQRKGISRNVSPVNIWLEQTSNRKAAEYIDSTLLSSDTLLFSSKAELRNHYFSTEVLQALNGMVLDFGVASGRSTLQIADGLSPLENRKVVGFDAFLGIRDAWSKVGRPPGSMSRGGSIPPALQEHPRVDLVVGWVEDTLDHFLSSNPGEIAFVHMDMDVYPPTRYTLERIKSRLAPGSVVVFDDFFGFVGWQHHSVRAFNEVLAPDEEWVSIGISSSQVAFRKQ